MVKRSGKHASATGMPGMGEMEAAVNILVEKALAGLRQMPRNG